MTPRGALWWAGGSLIGSVLFVALGFGWVDPAYLRSIRADHLAHTAFRPLRSMEIPVDASARIAGQCSRDGFFCYVFAIDIQGRRVLPNCLHGHPESRA